jgi:hypothetical protein
MVEDTRIVELMRVPRAAHDKAWLIESLHAAIKLEFATIPPYLTALWSIQNRGDEVAQSIATVVEEEMLHMGIACNLLAALGDTPRLNPSMRRDGTDPAESCADGLRHLKRRARRSDPGAARHFDRFPRAGKVQPHHLRDRLTLSPPAARPRPALRR